MLVQLKIVLLKRGISQTKIASAIGRSAAHVSRVIRGRAKASARDRRLIAEEVGISAAKLFPRLARRRRQNIAARRKVQKKARKS